jgi:hypothetical protein
MGAPAQQNMAYKDIQVILYRLAEQDRKLDAIHNEALKTNRRVSRLEKWQSFIEGGLAVLTILIVPLLIYVVAFAGFGSEAIAI